MNPLNQDKIESLLRHSPKPMPPRGLKERLIMQTRSVHPQAAPSESLIALAQRNWLQRWWPALVPTALSLASMAVIAAQQVEIRQLKKSIEALSAAAAEVPAPVAQTNDNSSAIDPSADDAQEIARLKTEIEQLTADIAQLEKLRAENQSLRAQMAAPPAGALTQEETDALAEARARAEKIACVNNLKQIGLAARVFAGDVGDQAPPDFLSMSNELGTAKILVCPGDHNRQPAPNFGSFTAANCSYEYLIASSTNWDTEPTRVMTRCPIHGTIGLCDGSVHMITTNHPEWFVQRDGKLYFEPPAQR